MSQRTPIIPVKPTFYATESPAKWDLKAICVFVATGFFLDRDTYFQNQKVVPPGTEFQLDGEGKLLKEQPYFEWYYEPRSISFEQATAEFTDLFESIIKKQVDNQNVILPLSGGLDSRTQAAALQKLGKKVSAYSYMFEGGYPEAKISQQIASVAGFPFSKFTIPNGYLWEAIEELASINQCYSEFTHPRQMAVIDKLGTMGEVFSLGHWGDVLFDRGVGKEITEEDFPHYLQKKIVKKGGMELAENLWQSWGLEGTFSSYLHTRLTELWEGIRIENLSARMRAFKSLYWAPRWTSTNLSVFSSARPITLPYYDQRMCEFICGVPEDYLADRKIQIAYIKNRNPQLAKITWQENKPFHLYNYRFNKIPYNLPYRIQSKLKREANSVMGKKFIQRNWELQFLGTENEKDLKDYLFGSSLKEWIPESVLQLYYTKFKKENPVVYSHPVSMLLTLAVKYQKAK